MKRAALATIAALLVVSEIASESRAGGPPNAKQDAVPAPQGPELAQNGNGPGRVPPPLIGPRGFGPRRMLRRQLRLDEDAPDRVPLSIDRQLLKEIETAGDFIGKQQFSEAVPHLQRVLDSPEDSWIEVPGPHGATFQSAKRLAAERIGNLPAQVRGSYETEFGQVARQLLDEALRRGEGTALAEVAIRYFHTRAGYKAAYALGNRLFDESMPLSAANQFERLRQSPGGAAFEPMLSLKEAFCWLRIGASNKCAAILSEIKQRPSRESVTIGGHQATIPDRPERMPWLNRLIGPAPGSKPVPVRDWLLAGGSPERNASSGDALPLREAVWTQSLIRDKGLGVKDRFAEIEAALDEYRREMMETDSLTIPSGSPLVIGNTVVFRTLARLRAVDLRTGQPLWDFAEPDRLYRILASVRQQTRPANRLPISIEVNPQDDLRLFLNARAFRDMTYAGLSSDGERVFGIFDGGFLGLNDSQIVEQNSGLGARNQNVLCAIDVATGRMLWELGGTRSDRNRDLAGTFFLGCGLPMGSALYVLGELDGDISLFKLDAATGKRIYTQRLATPLGRLPFYPLRRLAGGNPSTAAGLLICPTAGGVVTAFDPAARSLAWEYRYSVNRPGDPRDWVDSALETYGDPEKRWLDSAPLIVDGAVLLTPRDSDELHCLNLADGSLRWKQPRNNRLFLAGAADGVLYVIGRSSVEAIRLKDGSDAWSQPLEVGSPSGRGYRSGDLYHLPLASGDLATIDLRHGRILARTHFDKGVQPGNLVSAEGAVLMESAAFLQGFRPTAELEASIAKSLDGQPDDAEALATRGELRLHRGQPEAGLDDLTRSVQLRPDSRVQSIAVATALENLRFDFAASRALAERFGPKITDPAQRVEFHRLMAAGLARNGDLEAALQHGLELLQDDSLNGGLLPLGESLKVEVSQIVAPELTELFSKSNPDQRAQLVKKIERWIARVASEGQVEQLRRALDALSGLPVELELRRKLIAKLAPSDRAELVRQLTLLRKSPDLKTAGSATARLARLLIDHHRADGALELLAELGDRFKTVDCADAKTGAELATAWSSEPAVKAAHARLTPWPGSDWSVKTAPFAAPTEQITSVGVEQRGGSFYRHWRFESRRSSEQGFTLVAIDPAGNERWHLELSSRTLGLGALGDSLLGLRVEGPLIEVALRRRIVVLDGFDGAGPPRILWSKPLNDPHWSPSNQMRSEIGLIGLMSGDRVIYQVGSALCAADGVTGRTIWERRNIPFSYSLIGDDDYLVALCRFEPNDPKGAVLRTVSGAEVREAGPLNVPGPLMGDWHGRRVLTTGFNAREVTRSLIDPVAGKVDWTCRYPIPAWSVPIDDEEFGMLDAARTLHVHSATTGAEVFKVEFGNQLNSSQLGVRRLGNRYLVVRQTGVFRISPSRMQPDEATGIWAVDRDTGKIAWSAPARPPQVLVDLPAQSPVLVLLRPMSRFESPRSSSLQTSISILDAKTGKSIYEGHEPTSADRINVHLDYDAHAVIVTTDKHRLEVTAKKSG
jgi:outer membrane protein assembly factor BamB